MYCNITKHIILHLFILQIRDWEMHKNIMLRSQQTTVTVETYNYLQNFNAGQHLTVIVSGKLLTRKDIDISVFQLVAVSFWGFCGVFRTNGFKIIIFSCKVKIAIFVFICNFVSKFFQFDWSANWTVEYVSWCLIQCTMYK